MSAPTPDADRFNDQLRDRVAKAIADAAGHGMREKCMAQADAALAIAAVYNWPKDGLYQVRTSGETRTVEYIGDEVLPKATPNGGPVFPITDCASHQFHGISLRDYFATHAPRPHEAMGMLEHCKYRWRYADTMLLTREVKQS